MKELKQTPLFPEYKKLGGKIVDFGGWALPVQFTGIKEEHNATRTAAGLFDVSHMGEIMVEGLNSLEFLQIMLTNDVAKLTPNRAQYTMMCYENGGTVDDLIVYMLAENKYMLVVNAANTQKDFDWLIAHQIDGVEISDRSEDFVQLALQGPKAEKILQKITSYDLASITFFRLASSVTFTGIQNEAIVARTGYTGEDGFEIYISADDGRKLWNTLLDVGEADGLVPVGLGARDTLRFEANLALYGQELTADITPIEAGLSFAVKTNKQADFIGKEVLKKQKEEGPKRKLVGIEMIEKGIPRHGYEVLVADEVIGVVTSGTQSPTLGKNIGLALVSSDYTTIGTELFVQIRKKRVKAKIVSTPFYKRS
ncbi:glycine cleavage system aminomethyltransferase GcvT [Aquibacillus sp. 3ASR75-11]|uniref:Aminomethyltransferase n=1 Tax=Terrihalobacillus insolitus TaxID=2950438 RepID=A0A9X3WUC7_9BACI|nr:glycine cleavage system aminomethyltransferase GcvT [Terrihalobacillus insolitus]MDC3413410.1 glycine cleavage system aminomethyltransferase GcvT [Terrihalobacillus insolitus]MDC3424993.1 glycine cleavage system aminomethyltransferase GcvT [Terrihalobacillus insolitus]